jgi:hypothetical protein
MAEKKVTVENAEILTESETGIVKKDFLTTYTNHICSNRFGIACWWLVWL